MKSIQTTQDLTETIASNRQAFSNYNTVRMREVIRYLTEEKLELFLKIPFLLHINASEYPGFIDTDENISGIFNFLASGCCKLGIKEKIFPKSIEEFIRVKDPVIMALYHIGSLGTFTQSQGSDFDFWVIIDIERFSRSSYQIFEKKLDGIVKYCREAYDQQVTFFVMDYHKIRENNYQSFDEEETITAPKLFLKEEFYRTYLMIAGKIPVWSLLPLKGDDIDRNRQISQILPITPDLIDLGHISHIPFKDIVKGLLWHICKSIEDPVKALIKATTVFSYGFGNSEHKTLLCEKIKERYNRSGIDDFRADPYKVVFDRILDFHEACDPKGIHLVKNAIFFRLCEYPNVKLPDGKSPKRLLLNEYIRQWRLKKSQVKKLLSYRNWSESEKVLLEHAIIQRLAQMFNKTIQKEGDLDLLFETKTEKKQWRILKNKTRMLLQGHPKKVEVCSTFLKRRRLGSIIITPKNEKWVTILFSKDKNQKAMTFAFPSFAGAVAFILENELYKRHSCRFDLKADVKIFENEIRTVTMDDVYMSVIPVKPFNDQNFSTDAKWDKQLIFLFFSNIDNRSVLQCADLVSITSWGQVYADSIKFDMLGDQKERYILLAKTIAQYAGQGTRFFIFQVTVQYVEDVVYHLKKAIETVTGFNTQMNKQINKPLLDKL